MNNALHLPDRILDDVLPLSFVVMMIALIVLPAITFGIARKWSASQPDTGTAALSGAVIVTVVGILSAAFVTLVVLGWIPPLGELVHRGG
jgi:hypothetical protein